MQSPATEQSSDVRQITQVWETISPFLENLLPTGRHGQSPAAQTRLALRRYDQLLSAALAPIKPALLRLLETADLPPVDKEKLRKDLQSDASYLEPQGVFAFMAGDGTDLSGAAEKRNHSRLTRLSSLMMALHPSQSLRLRVDVEQGIVTVGVTPYKVGKKLAVYLQELIRSNGRPVTSNDVVKALQSIPDLPDRDKKEFRISREIKSLPQAVQDLIKTQPGAGSYLLIDKLA
jgi:hypothetical protein